MLVLVVLVINLICSILYAVVKAVRKEGAGVALFFLFLPVLGFVIYFLPRLVQKLLGKENYDRDSLVHRFQIDRMAEHPNVQEELGVVPVEDAMAVSGSTEKRALLLRQLKKDSSENYKVLLPAENDEDSESVHYVAAAKMEAYRLQQQNWMDCSQAHEDDPRDPEKFHRACAALEALIGGSVLSPMEQKMYKKKYCALVRAWEDGEPAQEEYETYLTYLVELGEYEAAEQFWAQRRDRVRSEAAYLKMMELFHQEENWAGLRACVLQLQADREVRLSAHGLERLRYWRGRCAQTEGNASRASVQRSAPVAVLDEE